MASFSVQGSTPDRVDLREFLWPVENLGQIPASAASAAATALEYHCNRIKERPTNLSAFFVHYNARAASGLDGANVGTTLAAAMKAITTHGACREESWPFDPGKLTVRPPAQAYDEARKFAAVETITPLDVFEALGLDYPVPFVAKLPRSAIDEAGRSGAMPVVTSADLQKDGIINHAMVLVGYDKAARTLTARNCWGSSWGQQGHCTIGFETFTTIAPPGQQRLWVIITPKAGTTVAATAAMPAASASRPERLADLAARMRQEIRGEVERDIADATTRIRDMMGRTPAAGGQVVGARDACPTCSGSGSCQTCGGTGCTMCGRSGRCPNCSGTGRG